MNGGLIVGILIFLFISALIAKRNGDF